MDKAERHIFAQLHNAPEPLLIYNAWDVGSAVAIASAGASAIATGSLAVAGARGFADGQTFPLIDVLATARAIVSAVDVPVSIDFEGGYALEADDLMVNAAALADTGAVGCNFEDQIVGGNGLHAVADQAIRIEAVASSGLFINARTDLFLGPLMRGEEPNRDELIDQAIERAAAYTKAGAHSFFVPGLSDPDLIARLCDAVPLPVNVMALPGMPAPTELAKLGVKRISWGPGTWRQMMAQLEEEARAIFTAN